MVISVGRLVEVLVGTTVDILVGVFVGVNVGARVGVVVKVPVGILVDVLVGVNGNGVLVDPVVTVPPLKLSSIVLPEAINQNPM